MTEQPKQRTRLRIVVPAGCMAATAILGMINNPTWWGFTAAFAWCLVAVWVIK